MAGLKVFSRSKKKLFATSSDSTEVNERKKSFSADSRLTVPARPCEGQKSLWHCVEAITEMCLDELMQISPQLMTDSGINVLIQLIQFEELMEIYSRGLRHAKKSQAASDLN